MSRAVVERFYSGFAACDAEEMVAGYAADVVFEDPVFGELRGDDAADMWRMLCHGAEDLVVEHRIGAADDRTAHVEWTAHYTFPATGRRVTNEVTTRMALRDGLIVEHVDDFSMWRWSTQALGLSGRLLGWTPFFIRQVRSNARRGLRAYQRNRG